MNGSRLTIGVIGALLAGLTMGTVAAAPSPAATAQPTLDAAAHKVLKAMGNSNTDGYPDQAGEFAGMQAYAKGHYGYAMEMFKQSARYADKLSQLSIGLMYADGIGVTKDPARGCAWLAIAAQRNFPKYVATRDQVCSTLSHSELNRAKTIAEKLLPVYGDAAAKPRMAAALQRIRDGKTGSRTGAYTGVVVLSTNFMPANQHGSAGLDTGVNCLTATIGGAPVAGCGSADYYAPARTDAAQYFASRDELWRGGPAKGTVTVKPLQQLQTTEPDQPPPASSRP